MCFCIATSSLDVHHGCQNNGNSSTHSPIPTHCIWWDVFSRQVLFTPWCGTPHSTYNILPAVFAGHGGLVNIVGATIALKLHLATLDMEKKKTWKEIDDLFPSRWLDMGESFHSASFTSLRSAGLPYAGVSRAHHPARSICRGIWRAALLPTLGTRLPPHPPCASLASGTPLRASTNQCGETKKTKAFNWKKVKWWWNKI